MNSFIFIVVIISVFVFFIAPYLFLNMHVHPPLLKNMFTPADFGLKYDDISVVTEDKIDLKGWYIPSVDHKSTVLVCHGVAANRSDVMQVTLLFNSNGYDVYTFDFRGHGETKKGKVTYGYDERKDIKAIVDYLKSKNIDKIGVYGLSMGASIVMLSLPENPELKVAVIDSGFVSVEKIAKYRIGMVFPEPIKSLLFNITNFYAKVFYGVSLYDITPIKAVEKVHIPILFVIGDVDSNITPDNGRMLFDKANDPKELLVIEGANHTQTINSPLFKQSVIDFMNKYLLNE
ncbi:MAG: alpha/beta hydrolase [Vampirovibrionia bacterium]